MDKMRALRYFKRVAELKSFSLAAQEFSVPSSSISRRIKDLESILGLELLKRSTRIVELTELGSLYYDMIIEGLEKLDDADELMMQRMSTP
ncbi:LysR family transcriptional regulator, partial [Vibrio anguillarum]|nr:LysR family transcriptional regulator [Vibrio anguillarum]